jgi:Sulfotransferase family
VPYPGEKDSPFYVPPFLDLLGGLVHHQRAFWLQLGRWESRLLLHELVPVRIVAPVYVCGLARSGSTLLHEIVASHTGVATHRIKDYPMVFTPCWWRRATAKLRPRAPRERAHQDRVLITSDSPDALDEMVWTAFFPHCHDPEVSNLLRAEDRRPAFETFYRLHIRKLLLAERATRYAAKANYHIARLPYLVRLFPDARFLIPVRDPVAHIASLMRQHQGFSRGQQKHSRSLSYMQRSGHFEFGLDRRPMNLGDGGRVQTIVQAWAEGEEVRGWACYWDMVHGHLARLLAADDRVRAAAMVVRFETLCDAPGETLRAVLHHCRLPDVEPIVARFAPDIQRPDYYRNSFSSADLNTIRAETAASATHWGY